jgi:hypothetical protein
LNAPAGQATLSQLLRHKRDVGLFIPLVTEHEMSAAKRAGNRRGAPTSLHQPRYCCPVLGTGTLVRRIVGASVVFRSRRTLGTRPFARRRRRRRLHIPHSLRLCPLGRLWQIGGVRALCNLPFGNLPFGRLHIALSLGTCWASSPRYTTPPYNSGLPPTLYGPTSPRGGLTSSLVGRWRDGCSHAVPSLPRMQSPTSANHPRAVSREPCVYTRTRLSLRCTQGGPRGDTARVAVARQLASLTPTVRFP